MTLVQNDSDIKYFNAAVLSGLKKYDIKIYDTSFDDLNIALNRNKEDIKTVAEKACLSDYSNEIEIAINCWDITGVQNCLACNKSQTQLCSSCVSGCESNNACDSKYGVCSGCNEEYEAGCEIVDGCITCQESCNNCQEACYSCHNACEGAQTCISCNSGDGECSSNCYGTYTAGCKICNNNNEYICDSGNTTSYCTSCDNGNVCSNCNVATNNTSCGSNDGSDYTPVTTNPCTIFNNTVKTVKDNCPTSFTACQRTNNQSTSCSKGFSYDGYECASEFLTNGYCVTGVTITDGDFNCNGSFSSSTESCSGKYVSKDGSTEQHCQTSYSGENINCSSSFNITDKAESCSGTYSGSSSCNNGYSSGEGLQCNSSYSEGDIFCSSGYSQTGTSTGGISCNGTYSDGSSSCSSGFSQSSDGETTSCTSSYKDFDGTLICSSDYGNTSEHTETTVCTNCNTTQLVPGDTSPESCSICVGGDATTDGCGGCNEGCNTSVACEGGYGLDESGGEICKYSYSDLDSGLICVVFYEESCSSDNGSNTCSSCDSSCYSGNTETCSECVSSCNSENTVCSKCHEGGWTAPCYQVCTPTNNSCAVTYANACATNYIAQCTVCVGGCYNGCNQGFSTSGCSSSNDMSGE